MELQALYEKLFDKLLTWGESLFLMLPNLAGAILVMLGFGLLARLTKSLTTKGLDRFSNNEAINRLLSRISLIVVLSVGVFISLGILHLRDTVLALLSGVGIIGLALGFAFQDIAANFISGIMIAVRKPFMIGDLIEVDGIMGNIENISMRTAVIRSFQGQRIIIPNKGLYQGKIKQYSTGERRIDIPVGVSYGDNLAEVQSLVVKTLSSLEACDNRRAVDCLFTEFGSSSIDFIARFWLDSCTQKDFLTARSDAIMAIQQAFNEADITIPFPIRTLDFGIKGGEPLRTMIRPVQKAQSMN